MNKAGLYSSDGRTVPLMGVEVVAEVLGGFSRVLVRQRYKSSEATPIEAVYTFPLPSDATLSGFTMTCDGRRVTGEVREREEAFAKYDEAIATGHGAALLEQERPNVFTASVGNLLPFEETLIEIEYVQRMQVEEGALRFMLPTLVAPRYIPGSVNLGADRTGHGTADPTGRVPDADRISPPQGQVAYGVKLDLSFDVGANVVVESPSHAVVVTREGGLVRVAFAQREVALDRDIVVTARGVAAGSLANVTKHAPSPNMPGVFALTVVPDLMALGAKSSPQDVVFVVDVSGSMDGDSLREAKAALRLCLRHLREGDRFNVIAFSDQIFSFMAAPVPFTQRTLNQIDAWVDGMRADGGTELLGPLTAAIAQARNGIVVLLTDGQVGNEEEILATVLAQRGEAKTRVYSFGIGTNVSDALLRDLATRTGGAVEQIHPGERIDEKVIAVFARATAPRVTDLSVTFHGVDVGELAPAELPALIDGEPWVLLGRYETSAVGRVELRGTRDGAPFVLECPVDLAQTSGAEAREAVPAVETRALFKLWARERIRDLEAAVLTGRRAEAMKDRIVKLAVLHGVASKLTSFVVIETRTGARRSNAQPETRVVPVNLPAGWAMFQRPRRESIDAMRMYAPAPSSGSSRARSKAVAPPAVSAPPLARRSAPPSPAKSASISRGREMDDADDEESVVSFQDECSTMAAPSFAPPAEGAVDPIVALLARQLASGMWDEPSATEGEDVRQVRATARALLELLRAGVTTTHPVHGSQVKKAVDALIPRATAIAATHARLAELALATSWLIASGHRTRATIEAVVASAASLADLRPRLDGSREGRLREDLEQMVERA